MPPALLRRPLTVSAWLVMSVLALALSPLLLAAAALASALARRPQPLLLARFSISYFAHELGVLVACGWLWLASGFGLKVRSSPWRDRHRRLLHWFVHGMATRALRLLRIEVRPSATPEASAALEGERPLLFFSRHAGPGDTVFLIDLLLDRYHRVPSVVFKEELTVDPSVDLIAHRLPHAVLDTSRPDECEERIAEVAANLEERGVLVLFPEGGNFTPARRRRALLKLWRKGRVRETAAGLEMRHVMPPHPGGALAALRGRPEADVVFSAHTGLGLAAFPRQLWRHTPIGRTFRNQMWLVRADERPADPDAQIEWLYAWWQRLDDWVDEQGEELPTGSD